MHPSPTPFDELNALLAGLVARARGILGSNFVGAYLQGSFAVGDADLHSDCDFIVAIREQVSSERERGLRALHDEIPTRPGHWTHHIEGSYAPVDELRTLDARGKEWLYIDHGRREMQWAVHCNNEVARWILRERGVTLAGPPARTLVDEVPPDEMREGARRWLSTLWPDLLTWITFDIAWAQRYAVASIARMLYTYKTAHVASKKASMLWAAEVLDERWRPLLLQAIEDRARGFDGEDPPRPGTVEATRAFWDYGRALTE